MNELLRALKRLWKASRAHGLVRSHTARVFGRFATLQILTRLSNKPVCVPFVGTTRIFASAGETGSNGNYYFGLHEFEDMAFLLHYLRPSDLFVDVGANVGSYTVLASGAVGARTVAFEPVPQTLVKLRANCSINRITSIVDVRSVCIGSTNGTTVFSADANTTNSIVSNSSSRPRIVVPLRRLDSEITEIPSAIKIDAENYDDDVLSGAEVLLRRHHPLALLVETIGGGAFGRDRSQSEYRLAQLGLVRCRYDPWTRVLRQSADQPVYNHLFIRNLEFARARVASAPRFDLNGFGTI
jgi:FkbM family methyltransferase